MFHQQPWIIGVPATNNIAMNQGRPPKPRDYSTLNIGNFAKILTTKGFSYKTLTYSAQLTY